MLDRAQAKASELGVLNKSFLKGDGNLTGFLGEEIAAKILNAKIANVDNINYNYDLILPTTGITIDVKTKKTKVEPKPHYECGVMDYNCSKQKCDYYAFVRIKNDYSVGWFLGVKEKYKYILEAKFVKGGTYDPRNEFTQMTDNYNLEISKLDSTIEPTKIKADVFYKMLTKRLDLIKDDSEYKTLSLNIKKWLEDNYQI